MKKTYSRRQTLAALCGATAILLLLGAALADGSVNVRGSVHAYPSFMFMFDVFLVGVLGLIVAVAWVKFMGRATSA